MRSLRRWSLCCLVPLLGSGLSANATPLTLDSPFGDGMVLQREAPVPVEGHADPQTSVTVSFGPQTKTAVADATGAWRATLDPLPAGVSSDLVVKASTTLTFRNIITGDVWFCSGQSNMALTLNRVIAARPLDVPTVDFPQIRVFRVAGQGSLTPRESVTGKWVPCNAANTAGISAVAFLFARDLQQLTHVPIGIIDSSYGGSRIEAWLPHSAYTTSPALHSIEQFQLQRFQNVGSAMDKFLAGIEQWQKTNALQDPGDTPDISAWTSNTTDLSDWKSVVPPATWHSLGATGAVIAWARKDFTISDPSVLKTGFRLDLSRWPYAELTAYMNGQSLRPAFKDTPFSNDGRSFLVPGSLLHAGKNTVALRAWCLTDSGSLPMHTIDTRLPGTPEEISGPWRVKFEKQFPALSAAARAALPQPPRADLSNTPTMLYNAMVAPLIRFPIRGFVWYQGESNADGSPSYGPLLSALIASWRTAWNNASLPFLIVQLPKYGPVLSQPGPSNWALLRESQLHVFLDTPRTGLATAIDLGDPLNIHPLDKAPVGDRLARWALATAYGQNADPCGPVFTSCQIEGDKVRLKFSHAGAGLAAQPVGPLQQFSIAGPDKVFVPAEAEISGSDILVHSDRVPHPVAVRYAWADSPVGSNLANQAGLPASPFRTDSWPAAAPR